jgi:RNA exonuclease NGL2
MERTDAFWHPRHVYERTRQLALFLRYIHAFRDAHPDTHGWPVVLAADFNTQPSEIGYWLSVSDQPPLPGMKGVWEASRVVHETVGTAVDGDDEEDEKEGGEEEGDPDRMLHHCRPATEKDGLMTWQETVDIFATAGRAVSLFDRPMEGAEAFGQRRTDQSGLRSDSSNVFPGDHEPMYTNFTPLWRCTLDYILCWPGAGTRTSFEASARLKMPRAEDL